MPKQSAQSQNDPSGDLPISLGPLQRPEAGQKRPARWLRIASAVLATMGCVPSTLVGAEGTHYQQAQPGASAPQTPGAAAKRGEGAASKSEAETPTSIRTKWFRSPRLETGRRGLATLIRNIAIGATVLTACSPAASTGAEGTPTGESQTTSSASLTPGAESKPGAETLASKRAKWFASLPLETIKEIVDKQNVLGPLDQIKRGDGLKDPETLSGVGLQPSAAEQAALQKARVDIVRPDGAGGWQIVCNGLLTGVVMTATHCVGGYTLGYPMGKATEGMGLYNITSDVLGQVYVRYGDIMAPVTGGFAVKQGGLSVDVAGLFTPKGSLLQGKGLQDYRNKADAVPIPGSSVYMVSTNGESSKPVEVKGAYLGRVPAISGNGFEDILGFNTKDASNDPCLPGASGAAAVGPGNVFGPTSYRMTWEGPNVTGEVVRRLIVEKALGVDTAAYGTLCAVSLPSSPSSLGKAYDLLYQKS